MSEKTAISWTDATFNPWWGCQKVSPACDHCYAERDAKRFAAGQVLWGVGAERRTFGDKHWAAPRAWAQRPFFACACGWRGERKGIKRPVSIGPGCPLCFGSLKPARRRVFCASMGDWLDLDAPLDEFVRLLDLINTTTELDWLLLSKRVGNWRKRVTEAQSWCMHQGLIELHRWIGAWLDGTPPANVWIGATVIDQAEADRDVPKLLAMPARVRFLSIEPMLGPIDLSAIKIQLGSKSFMTANVLERPDSLDRRWAPVSWLDWIIAGGESGPQARPSHPDWYRSLRDQCAAAGVPFHFKQWGEWAPHRAVPGGDEGGDIRRGHVRYLQGTAREPDGRFLRGDAAVARVGKAAAGRLLDGVTHDGLPA